MRHTRIFISQTIAVGDNIEITDDRFHYIAQVMRCRENTPIILFNGDGNDYHGHIARVEKKRLSISIDSAEPNSSESRLQITLAQGISRGERMTYAIQKAVELGVTQIQPLFTEHCEVRLNEERSDKRQQHWQNIAISATEQSGRSRVPLVHPALTLTDWLSQARNHNDGNFVLDPRAATTLAQRSAPPTSATLLIGPEGGLSDSEVSNATRADFTAIRFGPRILRTETAAAAAITALQLLWGDLGD